MHPACVPCIANLAGLACFIDSLDAETNAAGCSVHFEDDDLEVLADRKGLLEVHVPGHAALARRNQALDSRLEFEERAELRDARHAAGRICPDL